MIETLRNLPRPRDFKSLDDAQRYSEDLLSALERWHIDVPSGLDYIIDGGPFSETPLVLIDGGGF